MITTLSIIAAFAAAFFYGISAVFEQIGARKTRSRRRSTLSLSTISKIILQPYYLLGLACGLGAWLFSLLALRALPLYLVQSVLASSVVVAAVFAARHYHHRLSPTDKHAILGIIAGIAILSLAAEPGSATVSNPSLVNSLNLALLLLTGAALALVPRLSKTSRPVLMAALSGLSFGAAAVNARTLGPSLTQSALATNLSLYAIPAFCLLGLFLFTTALRKGTAAGVTAVSGAGQVLVPTLIGLAFLGDRTRPGLWPAALVGSLLVVFSSIRLSHKHHRHAHLGRLAPEQAA